MNNLLPCLVAASVLAGLTACMPNPEPVNQPTVSTGTSTMNTNSTSTANRTENTVTPTPAPTPTSKPMSDEERKAVTQLQWLNSADAARDAGNEIAQSKAENRKPVILAFVQRGLSYPGLNRVQMSKIRRKVNDKIVEGSGDMIFGPTHRQMRQKLRAYAIAYNQAILAAVQ